MEKGTEQKTRMPGTVPTRNQILTLGDMEDFKSDILQEVKRIMKECVSGAPGKKWLKSAEVKKLLPLACSIGICETGMVVAALTAFKNPLT